MCPVPSIKLSHWDLGEPVTLCSSTEIQDFLANPVSAEPWYCPNPEPVVQDAAQDAILGVGLVRNTSSFMGVHRSETNSHSDTSHDISRIPEADIARIWPAVGRVPWHHHEK